MLLNYVCYSNNSGYSQAAQDMIFALVERGVDIRVDFMLSRNPHSSGMTRDRYNYLNALAKKPFEKSRTTIFHCVPTNQRHAKGTCRNIGFATFETFQPPNSGYLNWIKILNRNDAIICPSEFNFRIFAHEAITKPIFYIPHCVNLNLFDPSIEPLKKYDKFTFLFFGSWRERKGYKQLIEAWCREFDPSDNVQLLIKSDKTEKAKATVRKIIQNLGFSNREVAPILYETDIFDEVQLPRFFKSVNCLISPTLGEGFGLPGLQCMAVGTPVAITNFSGCQDYANDETATMLEPSGFVSHKCLDNINQFANKRWAFITVDEIRIKMRYILSNYAEIKEKTDKSRKVVVENFSYQRAANLFIDMIEKLNA